jgi:hypothetical protein
VKFTAALQYVRDNRARWARLAGVRSRRQRFQALSALARQKSDRGS